MYKNQPHHGDDPGKNAISVYILGGIRLQMGEIVVSDHSSRSLKLWSVLSYFILNRDRAIPQTELIDLFWPEEDRNNPLSALKMLILRLRRLIMPLCAVNPILSYRSTYQWNPELFCEVDAERFEALRAQAADPKLPDRRKLELYREAVALYKGDLLPKQSDQPWLAALNSWYHNQYIDTVKNFATLLEKAGLYEEMSDLLLRADALHPMDEQLNILLIRSYLLQKKHISALRHYEKTVDLLYQTLGVRPSAELQSLYFEILSEEKNHERDLDIILSEIALTAPGPGAFFCEYGLFASIYRLKTREINRSGGCHHVVLLTVSAPDGSVPKLKALNAMMSYLREVLVLNLRQSDVVARYSKAQFIVLLSFASLEESTMVMERILTAFHSQYRKSVSKLTFSLRGLEPA